MGHACGLRELDWCCLRGGLRDAATDAKLRGTASMQRGATTVLRSTERATLLRGATTVRRGAPAAAASPASTLLLRTRVLLRELLCYLYSHQLLD